MGNNCCNIVKKEQEIVECPSDVTLPEQIVSEVQHTKSTTTIHEMKAFTVHQTFLKNKLKVIKSSKTQETPEVKTLHLKNEPRDNIPKIHTNIDQETNLIPRKEEDKNMKVKTYEDILRMSSNELILTPESFRGEQKRMAERYEVLEVIGKGGFGEVRRIRDKSTNQIRCIKKLSKSQCSNEIEFSEEIKILQRLVK